MTWLVCAPPISLALISMFQVQRGIWHHRRCSNRESQRLTKRRKSWRLRWKLEKWKRNTCLFQPSYSVDVSAFICSLESLHSFFLNTTCHSERIQTCHLLTVWSVWFNSAVSWVSQLQLEIALLQGELQTEKKQLLRHTQKLQALQQERRKTERNRHSSRQKVAFPFFYCTFHIS